MKHDVVKKAASIKKELIAWRRHIHKNPELSGMEKNTSAFVAKVLRQSGISVKTGIGGYGVVGLLKGKTKGPVIALRADMDALPVHEKNNVSYCSSIPGVMHACGHDVHIAVLLGAAGILSTFKDKLFGSVKFIFQPSEEKSPGGAEDMIKDGALMSPRPSAIVALHCFPEYPVGKAGIRYGVMTASADSFTVVIKGKGGHAARPHQAIDAIATASLAINAIHEIVGRKIDPTENAVISIGKITGGAARNVVADRVEFEGTIRTIDANLRKKIPSLIERTLRGVTYASKASYEFCYEKGCPSVINDKKLTDMVRRSAIEILGEKNVVIMEKAVMGAEDFSLFAEEVPGTLFRLGTGNAKKGAASCLHSSTFDVDEGCLTIGASLMAGMVVDFLSKGGLK